MCVPAPVCEPGQSHVQMLLPPEPQLAPPLYAGKLSTVLATTPFTVQPETQPVESVSTLIVSACGGNGGGGAGGGGEGGGMVTPLTKVMPPCIPPVVLEPTQWLVRGHEPPPAKYEASHEKMWQKPAQKPKKAKLHPPTPELPAVRHASRQRVASAVFFRSRLSTSAAVHAL